MQYKSTEEEGKRVAAQERQNDVWKSLNQDVHDSIEMVGAHQTVSWLLDFLTDIIDNMEDAPR